MKIACDICEKVKDQTKIIDWLKVSTEYSHFFLCESCADKFWDLFKEKDSEQNGE